ncbi:hypothetical protein NPIL_344661 [Nephila pilipes]|uniref:Uncharacterized protein n=1 Tax=Nephila pilipes TaxID=299642 RepID=A0A8X6QRM5_NEPPI|nr:hypothetical protein NPIL_344661 [Nephila pilipes]
MCTPRSIREHSQKHLGAGLVFSGLGTGCPRVRCSRLWATEMVDVLSNAPAPRHLCSLYHLGRVPGYLSSLEASDGGDPTANPFP